MNDKKLYHIGHIRLKVMIELLKVFGRKGGIY